MTKVEKKSEKKPSKGTISGSQHSHRYALPPQKINNNFILAPQKIYSVPPTMRRQEKISNRSHSSRKSNSRTITPAKKIQRTERHSEKSNKIIPRIQVERKPRISAPLHHQPLLEIYSPQKEDRVQKIIIEEEEGEIIQEKKREERNSRKTKNIVIHDMIPSEFVQEVLNIPVVPDEYEGIPRAQIIIPTRRPFGFSR